MNITDEMVEAAVLAIRPGALAVFEDMLEYYIVSGKSVDEANKLAKYVQKTAYNDAFNECRLVLEAVAPMIMDHAAHVAEREDIIFDALDTNDALSREKTAHRIASAIRKAGGE